ncbi:MAG: hypothetical protein Kow00114_02100 [Kiloniellaceae bacterium]
MLKRPSATGSTRPGSGLASRYRALLLTHRSLDEKLDAEMKRPLPDTAILRRIKRRKLAVKDEMSAMERLFEAMRRPERAPRAARRRAGPLQAGLAWQS